MRWMSLVLLLLASHAMAKPEPWMKRADPESLGLYLWVDTECPFSKAEIESDIRGEFLRARIKPLDGLTDIKATPFNLTIGVSCLKTKSVNGDVLGWAMSVDNRFGTGVFLWDYPQYGSLWVGGSEANSIAYLRSNIKKSAESALTDYLEANFAQ